jgi:hypothetical protein
MIFRLLLAASLAMGLAGPCPAMTFRAGDLPSPALCGKTCPLVVVAAGTIESATPAEFETFMLDWAHEKNVVVLLDSAGGGVVAAMELGRAFRRMRYAVAVGAPAFDDRGGVTLGDGACFSACVYAFMGGVRRIAPATGQLGIHKMFADVGGGFLGLGRKRAFDDGGMRDLLSDYARSMNVNDALVAAAESYQSESMHVVSREELRAWNLATQR